MPKSLMARYSLPQADRPGSAQGAETIKRRGAADRVELAIVHPDGTRDTIAMPPAAADIVSDILATLARNDEVALLADDAEISPEDAAVILGISCPLVRRRMEVGLLPFRRVGAHRRLRLSDVLALKQREQPMRVALEDLRDDTDSLMVHSL